MDTFYCLLLALLLSVSFCLQSVESEEACWFKCEKNKKCAYQPKEGRKVCILKRCLKPKSHGFCRRYTHRYYFDHKTFECKCFKYGGCYGSRNNFPTKHACESKCFPPPFEKPNGFTTPLQDFTPTISTGNTAPTIPTNTTAIATQMTSTPNVATNAPTTPMVTTSATPMQGNTPSLTTMTATTMPLEVRTTIASTSPTSALPPTTTTAPTTLVTTMVLTTPTTKTVQASTCSDVSPVIGLTFFPSGGANISEKKAYRCAEKNHTFAVYSFVSMACPIIICLSNGTYFPVPNNKCTVSLNLPPGDNTLTIPGQITSPGYDGSNNYQYGEAQYRWNIVTVGGTISINFIELDIPNASSYCDRARGDVIEIYCGFRTPTADFRFCNSMRPPSTIYCQQPCIVILLFLNSDYDTGHGFSLTWSLVI